LITLRSGLTALLAFVLLAGCGSAGPRVHRVDDATEVDLSGYWNDTDARKVAGEMVKDLLSQPWLSRFRKAHDGAPRVVVGRVRNRTSEHLSTATFVKALERELTNSGEVRFVASRDEREYLREERLDQAKHASDETAVDPDKEHAASFLLQGAVHSIVDQAGGLAVRWYQVNLELLDMETNEKVWIGETRIKKVVERDAYAP